MQRLKSLFLSKQFIKYFISGFSAFLVDFGLLNFQIYVLKFDPLIFGYLRFANVISTLAGLTVTFLLNRYWAFGERRNANAAKHGGKFIFSSTIVWIIHNLSYSGLVNIGLIAPIAKLIVMAVQMVLNYFIYRFVIFT